MSNFPFWVSKGDGTRTWVDRGDNRVARAMPTLRVQVVIDEPTGNVTLSEASGAQLEAQDQKVTGAAITVPKDSPPPGAITLDRGDPGAVAVQKKFAGSLKQFYAGQARIHARGGNAQTRTRTDRGDHQIEYLNQFGQEQVTLRVSESVYNSAKAEDFIPLDLLVGYIEGSVIPGSGASSATYNVAFYSRELYNPNTAPATPVSSETVLPPGVAYDDYPYPPPFAPKVFRTERANGAWFWLDLRGFPRDAVVGVDVYIYHNTHGESEETIVGSEVAASAGWTGSGDPTSWPATRVRRYHDSNNWIATKTKIAEDFPEYAGLPMSNNTSFGFSYLTSPLAKEGKLHFGTYIISTGEYLGQEAPLKTQDAALNGGEGKTLETWPGTNHPPYSVSYDSPTYWPGTEFIRKQAYYYFYNSRTEDDTTLTEPPSSPSWGGGVGTWTWSTEIGIGHVLYTTITETTTPKVPLQFEVRGLGVIGATVPDAYDYDDPFSRPQTVQLAEELPMASSENDLSNASVANHFEGTLLGTMYVDRKSHTVMWNTAD